MRTPLYEIQQKLGAKMVPFSGWEMPLSYSGVTDEHHAVRSSVGLFDISHMGRFELEGPGAEESMSRMVPTPVHKLAKGGAQYSFLLNAEGGTLDDIYIYKLGADHFFVIVNAANRVKDFKWMTRQLHASAAGPVLKDVSDETALLALQGPKSWDVLRGVLPAGKGEIPLRGFIETELAPSSGGKKTLIARTGYTGEKGYELVVPASVVAAVWMALFEAGREAGMKPIGLGARDTLRLEMGYPLYGHELTEETTPIDAALTRFIDLEKEFVGKERLVARQKEGPARKLIGFELAGGGVPREGQMIYSAEKEIGKVTSGNFSPTLRRGIGMGYVDGRYAEEGGEIIIDIRGKESSAVVVPLPFIKRK